MTEGVRNRLTGDGRPQRLSVWTARIMTTPTDDVPYSQAREITPIVARSPEHVVQLLWEVHTSLCVNQIPNADKLSAGQRERALLARFQVIRLTDEVWSNYDFISASVFTPI
jgi:ABC-type Mn2+/Zn2+ transport system ATPase subunit